MRLLLDADGLIKLHRAGVLAVALKTFDCVVPQAVYEEVVVRGRARLHDDAEAIEAILGGSSIVVARTESYLQQLEIGLGAGELGILSLLPGEQDAVIVSDDRRFLAVLKARGARFLTPADILPLLWRRAALTQAEAREALERLRPSIRLAAYWDARQDLDKGSGQGGGQR